eukprot:6193464-Pleurochrysis_carterae.AAC.2
MPISAYTRYGDSARARKEKLTAAGHGVAQSLHPRCRYQMRSISSTKGPASFCELSSEPSTRRARTSTHVAPFSRRMPSHFSRRMCPLFSGFFSYASTRAFSRQLLKSRSSPRDVSLFFLKLHSTALELLPLPRPRGKGERAETNLGRA